MIATTGRRPATDGRSPWRCCADGVRLTLVAGVPALLVLRDAGDAYAMALLAVVAVASRWARAPARVDALFVILLALDGWLTTLGAFETFNRNDTIGHLLLPAAVTPMLYHVVTRLGVLRPLGADAPAGHVAGVLVLASLTLALGTAWELTEWLSDVALGTNMSLGYDDTMGDLTADAAGAFLGAVATGQVLRAQAARTARLAMGR